MKTKIYSIDGKQGKEINLPKCFSVPIREDIVAKVLEAKKRTQPYSPSPVAGNQHSASGLLIHRRHVWKSQYGRGISRIPRKIMSKKGSQFNWEGAASPNTKGGRRAHPPKVLSMINFLKINKKEMKIAFESALSATASEKYILKKYSSLEKLEKNFPIVISNVEKIKIKELLGGLKKILGKELFELAIKKKKIRAGKGKMRGRKYKSNAGMLLVVGKDEKLKATGFDIINVKKLGIVDLAKGGLGRLTIYTENAIKFLENKSNVKIKEKKK